jgi:hypothetical protein
MENASFYKPKFENIDLMIHEEESEKKWWRSIPRKLYVKWWNWIFFKKKRSKKNQSEPV